MPADRIKTVLLVGWLASSTLLLAAMITPLLLPAEALVVLAPQCPERLTTGHACPSCAIANSFLLISGGRLDAAARQSDLGIPLYAALVWNECLAFLYTTSQLRRLWAQLRRLRQRTETEEYSCRL
jgi:hypothetical protein